MTDFRWKSEDDTFEFPGDMNSYLLEQKVAIKRGIPEDKARTIYTELRKRAMILEKLHKRGGVNDFHKLFEVIVEAYKQALFEKDSFKEVMGSELFYQLTYMSAVSASGISRNCIFQMASELPLALSTYFARIHLLVQKLGYDYGKACNAVGLNIKSETMVSLLLRFGTALTKMLDPVDIEDLSYLPQRAVGAFAGD
jgi:hypothetical protein